MITCSNCSSSVPGQYRFCLNCGAEVNPEAKAADPLVGTTIAGKFKLLEAIGSGAMGTIYKAEQTSLQTVIVIKLLHRHLLADPELSGRFHREALAASKLRHPNCVQILDFGQTDKGSLYIAMEYIQGQDLAILLEREFPLDWRRLIHIAKQICLALDEAHANGVLHRDLKPENIMVEDRRTETDFVKVVDFGIAKLDEQNPRSTRRFKTRTGIVCGTPEYMSPEQARGQRLDARSDVYALGVALYHLTTDVLPFDGESPIDIVSQHLSVAPEPPTVHRPDTPAALETLILTMMEKDREHRPTSVMDVHAELERIDRELAHRRHEPVTQSHRQDATSIEVRALSDEDLLAMSRSVSPPAATSKAGLSRKATTQKTPIDKVAAAAAPQSPARRSAFHSQKTKELETRAPENARTQDTVDTKAVRASSPADTRSDSVDTRPDGGPPDAALARSAPSETEVVDFDEELLAPATGDSKAWILLLVAAAAIVGVGIWLVATNI